DRNCTGCAVGRTFLALADEKETLGSIEEAIEYVCDYDEYYLAPSFIDEGELTTMIEEEAFTQALSYMFEGTRTNKEFLRAVEKYFPNKIQMDVDGLKVRKNLPSGVKRVR